MSKKFIAMLCFFLFCLTAAAAIGDPGYYEQLDLIANHADIWKQTDVFGLWGYTVTDLDQNSRLEIISASVQGTGFYTNIMIYEVNEAGDELEEVRQDRPDYDSAPDILVDSIPVFYDPESGIYYYIFDDIIRNGYAEVYENKRAVFLENGVWKEIPLASKATIYSDAEHYTITYTDPNGNPITGDQYQAIAETTFSSLEKNDFCFGWNMIAPEAFESLTAEAIVENLKNTSSPLCQKPQ